MCTRRRDHVRIDEDAGADDAAHDDHGGVEYSSNCRGLTGSKEAAQAKLSLSLQKSSSGTGLTAITLPQSARLGRAKCWRFETQLSVVSSQLIRGHDQAC